MKLYIVRHRHPNYELDCLIDFRNLKGGYTVPRTIFYNDASHLYANGL